MSFRTLDLNLLRVFDAVMGERHVTRAAQRLAMTQPAVSNALRRLRDAIGDDLFIAGPTGVTPTPRAQALWPTVRHALQSLADSIAPRHFNPRASPRSFTLQMADATAAVWLPWLVHEWTRQEAACDLRVAGLASRDPRPALEAGQADAAIGFFPEVARELAAQGDAATFGIEGAYACRYVGVMRAGHALAALPALTLDDYCAASHLRVNFAGRNQGAVGEALRRLGRTRRVLLTVEHFATAIDVVASSDLVTVLPLTFLRSVAVPKGLVCRDLPFAVDPIHVSTLWHWRQQHDPGHRWLREVLRAAGRSLREATAEAGPVIQSGDTDIRPLNFPRQTPRDVLVADR